MLLYSQAYCLVAKDDAIILALPYNGGRRQAGGDGWRRGGGADSGISSIFTCLLLCLLSGSVFSVSEDVKRRCAASKVHQQTFARGETVAVVGENFVALWCRRRT